MRPYEGLEGLGRSRDLGRLGELFFYDTGRSEGPGVASPALPLVLIHGLGDEADSFHCVIPALAQGRRVLAPDLPGFGRSVARRRVTMRLCLDALVAFLEAETPGGAILAGSSLGAALGELAAFRRPDLVKGLVLMSGGFPTPVSTIAEVLPVLVPFAAEKSYLSLRGRPDAAYRSLRPYYADLDALPEADRAFLARRVVERVDSDSQMRAYYSLFRSLIFFAARGQARWARRLAQAGFPVLVLWGAEDRVVPQAAAGLLAGVAKGASSVILEGAGHLPHQEKPAEVIGAIESFMASI